MTALVAVTGATGFVGAHLVRHLSGQGLVVRAVCRRPSAAPHPAAESAAADVRDAAAVKVALDGAGVVFHAAGLVDDGRSVAPADHWSVNLEGTRNVLAGAPPGARVVVLGTVSVYGPRDGGPPFTEGSRVAPRTPYAAAKLAAEVAAAGHPDAVVLRLATVYGPGMRGNYLRLLDAVARRRFVFVGDGANRRALVHVDDACRAAVAAMEAAAGSRYNVTDGEVHTMRDIVAAMAVAAGVPAPRRRIPQSVARLAGRTAPSIAKLTEDLPVSGDLLRGETPYAPRVGLVDGWRSTVEWRRRATAERSG